MSNRLNQERQARLEPLRMITALEEIRALGHCVFQKDKTELQFLFNGHTVRYYPYSGWASGKTIKNCRGLKNLLKQIGE